MLRIILIPLARLYLCACEVDQPEPEKPVGPKEIKKESAKPTSPKPVYKYSVNETSQQDPQKDFHSIEKPLIKGEKIHPQVSEDILK